MGGPARRCVTLRSELQRGRLLPVRCVPRTACGEVDRITLDATSTSRPGGRATSEPTEPGSPLRPPMPTGLTPQART